MTVYNPVLVQGIELETNGTPNGSQTILNIAQGSNMTITDNGTGTITFDSTGGGGSSIVVPTWTYVPNALPGSLATGTMTSDNPILVETSTIYFADLPEGNTWGFNGAFNTLAPNSNIVLTNTDGKVLVYEVIGFTVDGDGNGVLSVDVNFAGAITDLWSGTYQLTFIAPTTPPPGGLNTEVQFNNNGTLAGDLRFVFDPSFGTTTFGLVSNMEYLTIDGLGNLTATGANISTDSGSFAGTFQLQATNPSAPQIYYTSDSGTGISFDGSGTTNIFTSGLLSAAFGATGLTLNTGKYFGDGSALTGIIAGAGGANTNIQFNSSGGLSGASNFTFDGTNMVLGTGAVTAVTYYGDGSNLTGIIAGAAGSTGQVQYNNSGVLDADSGLTYDGSGNLTVSGSYTGNGSTLSGITITQVLTASSVSPAADGTYTLPTSITIQSGIITAIS